MRIIDFHNHFYPPEYLEAIKTGPSNVKLTYDADKNPLLHYPGDYNVVVRGHTDIGFRAEVLEKAGVDKQILSFTTPGTHVESPKRSVELARLVNDSLSKIMKERRERFSALATLPLNDPKASVAEIERAFGGLGFKGVMLHSNINGVALSDKRFWPLYEKANELEAVLYIHPSFPVGVEAMTEYRLMPLVGFPFETTLAAAKLVFSGVVEEYPGIKWVLCHLGGAIPYLVERLDRGYFAYEECRTKIDKPPSEYLKLFFYDSVNFDIDALEFAVNFAGDSQFVAGSDYPHKIGSLDMMISSIDKLDFSRDAKARIFGENAARLLKL